MSDTVAMKRFGVVPPAILQGTDGLALLRGMCGGRHPLPPIWRLSGFAPIEAEAGRVVVAGIPGLEHYNPLGVVHGGSAATPGAACSCRPRRPASCCRPERPAP